MTLQGFLFKEERVSLSTTDAISKKMIKDRWHVVDYAHNLKVLTSNKHLHLGSLSSPVIGTQVRTSSARPDGNNWRSHTLEKNINFVLLIHQENLVSHCSGLFSLGNLRVRQWNDATNNQKTILVPDHSQLKSLRGIWIVQNSDFKNMLFVLLLQRQLSHFPLIYP